DLVVSLSLQLVRSMPVHRARHNVSFFILVI
ncbi:MAG: hypothetical protein ACI8UQ_001079, partial [Bacteroidia bacterium]